MDVFPTLLELSGAAQPAGQVLDGESLVPLWRNPSSRLNRDAIYVHFPGYLEGYGAGSWRTSPVGTIHAGDFKLLEFFEDGRLELYDLRVDLSERNNLARKMPEKVRELHGKLVAWRKELNAAMPRMKTGAKEKD